MNEGVVKILIAEYIPTLNKGELAILKGMLKTFELLGKTEINIFSFYPMLDRERYPPEVGIIDVCRDLHIQHLLHKRSSVFNLLASFFAGIQHLFFIIIYKIAGKNALRIMGKPIWHKYYESDVFIVCHDEVDCVNGVFLLFSPIYISLLAKTLCKPVVVYASGQSKISNLIWIWRARTKKLWKIFAKYFLSHVDLITTRDDETFAYFKDFSKGKVPIYFAADPAILLNSASLETVRSIMLQENIDKNGGLLIGVAISRGVLLNAFQCLNPNERYKKAIEEIARLLDQLIQRFHATVVFIPHCIEHFRHNDDRTVAMDVYRKMANGHKVRVITKEYSPEELKGLIGQFDLLISGRVHAAISALSMGVPCCMIANPLDRRPYNLIGKTFKQEKWIFNVNNLNVDMLYKLLTDLIYGSDDIRKGLPIITNSITEKALFNGRLLKTLLNSRLKVSVT